MNDPGIERLAAALRHPQTQVRVSRTELIIVFPDEICVWPLVWREGNPPQSPFEKGGG